MRLLLASNNQGKVRQIKSKLEIPWSIVTSEEIGLGNIEIEETGQSFEENARLKARGFFKAVKAAGLDDVAVLGDDGGVEIDALNGEPGIHAKRWVGENATDEQIIDYTLKRLEGVPVEKRTARFKIVEILILPDGTEYVASGLTEGAISETKRNNKFPGLPYCALLKVAPTGKIFDDLEESEKTTTHRISALAKIRDIILMHDVTH